MTDDLLVALTRGARHAAPLLLGATLTHGGVSVQLTEVEAYEGESDPASHTWRGRTARNAHMFGPPGHLYCYTMHGHVCCNVVCSPEGIGAGVLLRAGCVVAGEDVASQRRGNPPLHRLARGPGCLTKALAIRLDHGGTPLFDHTSPITLEPRGHAPEGITSGPRVNVPRAADEPLRFFIGGDPTVSAYKRSKNAAVADSTNQHTE